MKNKRYILVVLLLVIFFSYLTINTKANWVFEKAVDNTIYFSQNRQFKIDLYDVKYIGQLNTNNNSPLFILSGRGCENCDENVAIYIYSPSSGLIKSNGYIARYSYPGKEYDYVDNKIVFESRMFYGNCLKNKTDSIVWFQKELNDEGIYEDSMFTIEAVGNNLKETIVKESDLQINETMKDCTELTGVDFTTEP